MQFKKSLDVAIAPDQVWPLLLDLPLVAACMPGAALSRQISPGCYEGTITMRLGPLSLAFAGAISIEQVDAGERLIWLGTRGADPGGKGGFAMVTELHLQPSSAGSTILSHTDMTLTGGLAAYNDVGLVNAAGDHIASQFSQNLKTRLVWQVSGAAASSAPPPIEAGPISATALVGGMLKRAIRKPFGGD